MKKIIKAITLPILGHSRTVKDYIDYINSSTSEMPRVVQGNALILSRLPETEQAAVKGILEKESAMSLEVVARYMERVTAVEAPNKTPAQKQLMNDYGLFSEAPAVSFLMFGLNKAFNHGAEKCALKKDLSEVAKKQAYDPNKGRAVLDNHGLVNMYKI